MSLCVLAPKSLRRINRRLGTRFVHASAHHNGVLLLCVTAEGEAWWVDRRSGKWLEQDDSTTARRIREERAREKA